jgi:hypothetical protein
VKPEGAIGFAAAGLMQEIEGPVPQHLREWWTQDVWSLHSASWWRRHWERTEIVAIETADTMPNGWQRWLDWLRVVAPENELEITALEADRGTHLGYVRVVGRRQGRTKLIDPIASIPAEYTRKPLLRSR